MTCHLYSVSRKYISLHVFNYFFLSPSNPLLPNMLRIYSSFTTFVISNFYSHFRTLCAWFLLNDAFLTWSPRKKKRKKMYVYCVYIIYLYSLFSFSWLCHLIEWNSHLYFGFFSFFTVNRLDVSEASRSY
jgi:hypothetical protein